MKSDKFVQSILIVVCFVPFLRARVRMGLDGMLYAVDPLIVVNEH
jgi:hypothetical protein